ncbi:MAG: hypothetical protein NT031_08270 [Planctomycetota bacterium]|nr:hypothetical protein [Planctomycetota bacterium]
MDKWNSTQWLVFWIPFILAALTALGCLLLRNTLRTRYAMARQLTRDAGIDEWLILFDWSRKVLYTPTIIVSLAAGIVSSVFDLSESHQQLVGGVWLAVFFLNFLVDEYEVNLKVLVMGVLLFVATLLWLIFLGWVESFFKSFRTLGIRIDAAGYFVFAAVFFLAVAISWIRGLFYYVAITPNYVSIQVGPTETAEQISREEFSTRIDTGDFLERLQGYGRLVVTFKDHTRLPLSLLVRRVGAISPKLESIRGKLAVDRMDAKPGGVTGE